MRTPDQLVHSRACVGQRFSLMPLEGFPSSRLPEWPDSEAYVLASPALGAGFVQYLIDMPPGSSGQVTQTPDIETFHYVLDGQGAVVSSMGETTLLSAESYGLTPPDRSLQFKAQTAMRLLILQKRYEPTATNKQATAYTGHADDVATETWADNPSSRLQTLLPDDVAYDLAINIFTFDPGCGLPIVETHVMEHGLLFLDGRGMYYLDGKWMEVERDDFIWMGAYCPQSFYATGPTPSRYIYYKNVNREITL